MMGWHEAEDVGGADFRLRAVYQHPVRWFDKGPVREKVRRLVTALRLCRSGHVAAPVVFYEPAFPTYRRTGGGWGRSRVEDVAYGPKYHLTERNWQQVVTVYKLLERVDTKGLRVGLDRFSQAYTRRMAEDRIIDLCIALESTLLAGEKDELQYRLSLRGAALLSHLRGPTETQKLLRIIYGARSKIVHDGKSLRDLDPEKIEKPLAALNPAWKPEGLAAICEDVVRDVLRTYLERPGNTQGLADVNKELNCRIVEGVGPPQ
jgi:hypothetical protein